MGTIIMQMLFKKQVLNASFHHIFATKQCNNAFSVFYEVNCSKTSGFPKN